MVFGAQRPGMSKPNPDLELTPRGPSIPPSVVNEWCSYIRSKGVHRIAFVLTNAELAFYEKPLPMLYQTQFVRCTPLSTTQPDLLQKVMTSIFEAIEANEPIVLHCSTGQTRTADILAAYLHHRYHIPIPQAIDEIISTATMYGAIRRPSIQGVVDLLMGNGTNVSGGMSTMYSPRGDVTGRRSTRASLLPMQLQGPIQRFHVIFLQFGGTIDHDCLLTSKGPEFRGGSPAAERILYKLNKNARGLGFSYEFRPVIHDGEVLQDQFVEALSQAITETEGAYYIVTTQVEKLTEVGIALQRHSCASRDKVIIVTGSSVPERFSGSDADFNIGACIGALNFISPGIYTCLHGAISSISTDNSDGSPQPKGIAEMEKNSVFSLQS